MFQKFVLLVTLLSIITATICGCDSGMKNLITDALDAGDREAGVPTISLQLHSQHSIVTQHGVTHLNLNANENSVILVGTLSEGVFKQGDDIFISYSDHLRRDDNPSPLVWVYKIGTPPPGWNGIAEWKDIADSAYFSVEIPKNELQEDNEGTNYLRAIYHDQSNLPSSVGESFAFTLALVTDVPMVNRALETDMPTISLQLHPQHSIVTQHDGTTHINLNADEDSVIFIGILSEGAFEQGDSIFISYSDHFRRDDDPSPLVWIYKVGTPPPGWDGVGEWKDIAGSAYFSVEIPRNEFQEDHEGTNYLRAIHDDQSNPSSSVGESFAFTLSH